jgi:hypothetical protein
MWWWLHYGGSVAAKFEYTAYSKLAAGIISNMGIFEYTYVYSKIHGCLWPNIEYRLDFAIFLYIQFYGNPNLL